MHRIKRGVFIGFLIFWLLGFVLVAPSPLYRLLFVQANNLPLDAPVRLFEGIDWTHPYYYQDIGRAYRNLIRQVDIEMVYMYFDSESLHNTSTYIRYFREYQLTWAYPTRIKIIKQLTDLHPGDYVMISTMNTPSDMLLDCISGEAYLHLCRL